MFLMLLGLLVGIASGYSYWENCSFIFESNPVSNFCAPQHPTNIKNPNLDQPCGFPLLAPYRGYCKCAHDLVLSFCPQNIQDPFKQVPYERSCLQLCRGADNPQNILTRTTFSTATWQNQSSQFSSPIFNQVEMNRTGVTACEGTCLMQFSATYDATSNTNPNIEYELRFVAYTESISSVSFCPPAYRPDVKPECIKISLFSSPTWQSYVIASGALNNPGTGPFTPNANTTREGFSFLIQTSRKVFVDDLRFIVVPVGLSTALVLNEFNSATSGKKPEPTSQTGPSYASTDVTPALIFGNSSEHDINIFYCRALFYDPPNASKIVQDSLSFFSNVEISVWEASHFHVNLPDNAGLEDGIWRLTSDEISDPFLNVAGTTVSCTSPDAYFSSATAYPAMTTLCHSALCDEPCLTEETCEEVYGIFTTAVFSVTSCSPNFQGFCGSASERPATLSKWVNPKQDNTLNVSQRSRFAQITPFAVPHPLRGVNTAITNQKYVYLGLKAPFRLHSSEFLGFYSPSIQSIGQSLGFATIFDSTQPRLDLKYSLLHKNQNGDVSVDIMHDNGIGVQCFGEHVKSNKCSVNHGGCHPSMTCDDGYLGAKNVLCTADYDDPSTCVSIFPGQPCNNPRTPLNTHRVNQDPNTQALAFDVFQCEVLCGECGYGWLQYHIDGPYEAEALRASPRGNPANADAAQQQLALNARALGATYPLCVPCPGVAIDDYHPLSVCSGNGECSLHVFDTFTYIHVPLCLCQKDPLLDSSVLWVGPFCNISTADACNYGPGNSLGGFVERVEPVPDNDWTCQCNTGYTEESNCFDCDSSYFHPANSPKMCVFCDPSTCDPTYGTCEDGIAIMPWGGGCRLKEGMRASPGATSPSYECVAPFPGLIATKPDCLICNPELSCNGQSCNTDLSTLGGVSCICDEFHEGENCSSCRSGYYGPDCLPCPAMCKSPRGTCTGTLSSSPCACAPPYRGPYCQYSDLTTCNGHGSVSDNGLCFCQQDLGWAGIYCNECADGWSLVNGNCQRCNSTTCNGHGVCLDGNCKCDAGFDLTTNCSSCLSSYFPAGVCATECTSALCNNRGACDSNGQCLCSLNSAGTHCEKCADGYWLNGTVCAPCVGSPVCGGSSIGVCSATGTCQCMGNHRGVGCVDPVVLGAEMVKRKLYVSGVFLTPVANVTLVGSGTAKCSVVNATAHLECDCPALAPDETWRYSLQVFTSDDRKSNVFLLAAPLPTITSLLAMQIPTNGGVNITLIGNNFGLVGGAVLVTDITEAVSTLPLISQTDTQIVFVAGAGSGVSTVRVKVGNTTSQSTALVYYMPPKITSVLGGGGSTKGQTNITIQGENFGLYHSLATVIFENGAACTINLNCNFSHFSFCCSTPPGFGKMKINLTVASLASVETAPQYYVYDVPQIISVTGCPTTILNGTADCNPLGGTLITINGTNFGNTLSLPGIGNLAVLIGGVPCTNMNLVVPHSSLSCLLPPGMGVFKVVQVMRTGRSNQVGMASLISYAGPVLKSMTIKPANFTEASSGFVNAITTQSGMLISFEGQGFSNVANDLKVRYGPAASDGVIGWQDCLVSGSNSTSFNCTTTPGVGKNLVFRATLRVGTAYYSSDLSTDVYNYPAPTLTSARLGNSFENRSAFYVSQVADGELLYISGNFFGTQPDLVKVFYGVNNYACTVQTVNETELTCLTSIGSGTNHTFRVEVGYGSSMQAANGTDQFSYPTVPSINSVIVLGCGNPPYACPTDAVDENGEQILMMISGTNMAQVYRVLVGDQACTHLHVSNDMLSCYVPRGVGRNKNVVVFAPRSRTVATTKVSYALPVVSRVSGCTNVLANTLNCLRTGATITVEGTNFGLTGARVLIGGKECIGVVHNGSMSLRCVTPASSSSFPHKVIVLQSGQISSSMAYLTYLPCAAGSEERDGVCIPCNMGSFSIGAQCVACEYGSVSPAGASSCSLCEIGKFNRVGNVSVCSNCAPGRSTMAPGQTECEDCPLGRYSAGNGPCSLCASGSYQASSMIECSLVSPGFAASGLQLTSCSLGTFASAAGASVCSLCGPGKFSVDNNTQTSCTYCPEGRFQRSAGQSSCTKCPEGSSSLAGSVACQACPIGRSGFGCTACEAGKYAPISGLRECLACTKGKYGNATGLVLCLDCPSGRFANASMQETCMACPVMTFASHGATSCSKCDTQNTAQSNCVGCAPGKYFINMTCSDCLAGRVTSFRGQTQCETCAMGHYSNSSGGSMCHSCPAGYFSIVPITCEHCPPGTHSHEGQSACRNCLPGKFAGVSSTNCELCSPGKFNVFSRATACVLCESGTFSSIEGAENCLPCGPGKFSNASGSSSCQLCVPGKYSRGGTGQACIDCIPAIAKEHQLTCNYRGSHSPRYGASNCISCPYLTCSGWDANFLPLTFDTSRCFPVELRTCQLGEFASPYKALAGTLGQTKYGADCEPCQPGKYKDDTEFRNYCDSCPSGSVNMGDLTIGICVECQPGKYSDGVTCLSCPSGRIANYPALTSCTMCAPGRLPTNDLTECVACPSGRFSTQDPQFRVTCEQCVAGRYASRPGYAACRPVEKGYQVANSSNASSTIVCPAGTYHPFDEGVYLPGFDPAPCLPCGPGSYSEIGASICQPCPAGYFSNASGATSCFRCPMGLISKVRFTQCEPCKFGEVVVSADACRSCESGRFKNSTSLVCIDCPPGTAQFLTGKEDCLPCRAGEYSSGRASFCPQCPIGKFTDSPGQANCTRCQPGSTAHPPNTNCSSCTAGKYSTLPEEDCSPCAAGRFSNEPFPQMCAFCEPGKFASSPEQAACELCREGEYQPDPGRPNCLLCSPGTASTESRLSCLNCEAGKFSSPHQTECIACLLGSSASLDNSSACNPCEINEASLKIDNATFCYPCVTNALPEPQNFSCQCVRGYYQSFTSKDIYRPDNLQNGTGDQCKKCPEGMNCGSQRVSFNTATAKPGYWCEQGINQTDPIYYECRVWSYCLGGATCECADNRAGVLCSVCRPGYHTLPDNSCAECPSTGALSMTYVLGVSIAVLLLMSIVYAGVLADDRFLMVEIKQQFISQRTLSIRQTSRISTVDVTKESVMDPGNEEELAVAEARSPVTSRTQQALLYKRRPKIMGQLKIILGFFQITSHLTRALAVPWPTTYLAFMSFFSVARIDLLSVIPASCLGELNYYDEFTFVALLPLLILGFLTCTYLIPRLAKDIWCSNVTPEERRTKIDTLFIKWKKLSLFTLFALYPTISVNAAQLFICVDIKRSDETTVSYLAKDVNLVCYDDTWKLYFGWGVVSLLLYSAGIPLFFFLLLLKNRPHFSDKKIRYQLGFVYEAYAPNIWFFEIVDMCHKFLLTCFIFLVRAPSQVQLILGMLFCISYLVIILLGNPYLRPTDDRLHKLAQVLIFLLLLAALNKQTSQNQRVSRTPSQTTVDEVLGSTFLITVTVGFLLVLLYQVLYVMRVGIKRVLNRVRNKQEERTPTLATRKSSARDFSQSRVAEEATEEDEADSADEEEG